MNAQYGGKVDGHIVERPKFLIWSENTYKHKEKRKRKRKNQKGRGEFSKERDRER
jgi:hypothetical protein